jgi:thiol:disulfide interchange protein
MFMDLDRDFQRPQILPCPGRLATLALLAVLGLTGFIGASGIVAVAGFETMANAQFPPTEEPPAAEGTPQLSFGNEFGFGSGSPGLEGNDEPRHVQFQAEFKIRKGTRDGMLSIQADLDPTWYTYSITQQDGGPQRSRLRIQTEGVELVEDFVADRSPRLEEYVFWDVPSEEHDEQVIWMAKIRIPEGPDLEQLVIETRFDGQVCQKNGTCIPLDNIIIEASYAGSIDSLNIEPAAAGESSRRRASSEITVSGLLIALGLGFLGGTILNLMPCVLPVIGLKILSFAQQAGKNRKTILALNLWFSLGLLSVFWLLAGLSAFLNLGWGEQFTFTWFKLLMTGVVFVMALSFLGTWEIPIPGFSGSGKTDELQKQEGMSGAFFKGIFTTILATPCSGPLLGPIFAYTLNKPPYVTFLLFSSIGLGMASPYLVIGAVPSMIRFLPKPGMWMETFKEFMGFLLLGTVVYLFTTIDRDYFIASLTMLMGLWFGCWMIGRIPYSRVGLRREGTGSALGAVASAVIGMMAFTFLVPQDKLLPWAPYSPGPLLRRRPRGRR